MELREHPEAEQKKNEWNQKTVSASPDSWDLRRKAVLLAACAAVG